MRRAAPPISVSYNTTHAAKHSDQAKTSQAKRYIKYAKTTYNSGDSLVVTDPTTNPPLTGLTKGEQTGSRIFQWVWSYVTILGENSRYGVENCKKNSGQYQKLPGDSPNGGRVYTTNVNQLPKVHFVWNHSIVPKAMVVTYPVTGPGQRTDPASGVGSLGP
ncbi:hypothetical protein NM208_g7118 [Fusarium decemcellulare]|uniref:Uncharacterized protein n=1 Tax=Fusarium decemcellulare TaxID=57161 RepID=A0ACC1SAC1_9HYPO|nr:hypothetical protein NM208_g7118 [Fusarium decemcellulare]